MANHGNRQLSDKGIGFAAIFGLLAVASALVLFIAPTQQLSAWGFAAAMAVGSLLVAGLHIFGY